MFEQLLHEEEGPTLDFKRDQYPFAKASESQRAELLKDILGFANAWRRTEAYILIGVQEIRGNRSIVHGIQIDQQLTDHTLQQFVNSLTNRPINFNYEAATFENKAVGIIRIEQQVRPFYLNRDYGALKKNFVYVRRGSSTDPTRPALPDEIAQMQLGSAEQSANLQVEFAEVSREDALGTSIEWNAEFLRLPARHQIPFLESSDTGLYGYIYDPLTRTNTEYFRELAQFEYVDRLYRPVRLVIKNIGSQLASNVRIEIELPRDGNAAVLEGAARPAPPSRRHDFGNVHVPALLSNRQHAGYIEIDENDHRFRIEADCGDLQPSRHIWSDTFHVAVTETGTTKLVGRILASNLPKAQPFELSITASVTETTVTVEDLLRFPKPKNTFNTNGSRESWPL